MFVAGAVRLWLLLTFVSTFFVGSYGLAEWLQPNSGVEFDSKRVPHVGLLNRLHWVEKTERSTSRNYTFWEKADVYLLEWPGNITNYDSENPLVKWGKRRAKYLEDTCASEYLGIEMRVYAFDYVYVTWGPNRLTSTYTTPLTVPRSIIAGNTLAKLSRHCCYDENKFNTVVIYDFAFTYDTLLLAYSDGVIRVSGLEMAWAEVSKAPKRKLKYSLSRGIFGPVNKIVVQSCCLKTDFCPDGNLVVAYQENSFPFIIYTSADGGKTFERINPVLKPMGSLKLVLSYPEYGRLLVFHGNETMVQMNQIQIAVGGHTETAEWDMVSPFTLSVNGNLQGSRLGLESSFVIWDKCGVWYSPDTGYNITRSLLYIHKTIRKVNSRGLHLITSEHCSFGEDSSLTYGNSGKFAILDMHNTLYVGIDVKTNLSQLVGMQVDMTLLLRGKELSVAPFIEPSSDQPKLMYPPRYLELPKSFNLGKSYDRRLGMRLLPKNVYPSDYILSFYKENVIGLEAKELVLNQCLTSSLQVNNSITQKRKLYYLTPSSRLNFTVTFTSRSRKLRQLQFEPHRVLKYLSVKVYPESIDIMENENPRYFIKYRVLVKSIMDLPVSKLVRLNFFTKQDLRCNYQPRVTVFIKVEVEPSIISHNLSDEDMSRSVYLKSVTAGETTYLDRGMNLGETFKVETCPFKK